MCVSGNVGQFIQQQLELCRNTNSGTDELLCLVFFVFAPHLSINRLIIEMLDLFILFFLLCLLLETLLFVFGK